MSYLNALRRHYGWIAIIPLVTLMGCTCGIGISQKQGAYAYCKTTFDPPANSLASIDTSQAWASITTQNGTVNNTSGTFTIEVTDTASGELLGQQSFAYTISGDSVYAQDPSAVHNWLDGFTQYGSEEVTVAISAADIDFVPTVQSGTATLGVAANYNGVTYASATLNEKVKCPPLGQNCQPF